MRTTPRLLAALALAMTLAACGTSKSVVTVQEATGITKGQELVDLQRALKEGALTPDYTHDQVWSDLQASMKAREELLKMAFRNAGKATVYDEATGEAVPVCPAKGTKPSIAVTFKTT